MLFSDAAIIRLETVDSTNNYAANLLKLSQVPEGTVITALEQTQGRGQRGARWSSSKGDNLLCSIVLYPTSIKPDNQFALIRVVALAVHAFVEELTESDVYIKWPNDIIVADKKVAGILIETNLTESRIQNAVVGIGVNINQKKFDEPNAVSIGALKRDYFDIETSLEKLLRYIEKYYLKLLTGNDDKLKEEYLSYLYNKDIQRNYIYRNEKIEATIIGVEASGKLRLRLQKGEILDCDFKEIALVLDF